MKILSIFNHYLEGGGEARAVDMIANSLTQVLSLGSCEFSSRDWIGPRAPPVWQQALWMIRNPASVEKLRHLETQTPSDAWLVHNVFPVGSGAVYEEAKRLQMPVVQYLHNFRPFSVNGYLWAGNSLAPGGLKKNYWSEIQHGAWQDSRIKTAWFALVLSLGHTLGWWRTVKAWIAISEFMRERFVEAGVPSGSIFTLRHFWRPRVTGCDNPGDHYLFLGRLTEAKGVQTAIAAWTVLENRLGAAAPKLVIAGDGPLRSFIVSQAERLGSVTYAGPLSDEAKEDVLARARAVIAPSLWWEALGLVVYEAYDYERPVLVARSGGLTEIVIDSETGLVHEPGNVEQLAEQVMTLESNRERRRELGKTGRRWLLENASEAEWQRRFLEIAAHACS